MEQKTGTQNKLLRGMANLLSVLLHPVFMPLFSVLLLYVTMPGVFAGVKDKVLSGWLIMILINTIMFPIILLLLLKGLGFIKSIYLREARERVIPLIGTMVFYFWPYLVAKNVQAPELARVLLLGNFWGIVAVFIITIFFKISMHTSGAGALLGFVLVMMLSAKAFLLLPFGIALVAALKVGWARHILGAHHPREIWLGYIIGIVAQLGAWFYLA